MLIVAGSFEIAPEDREAFIAGRHDAMVSTRQEAGCLEYVMAADPLDAGRIILLERWEDQASFDAHVAGLGTRPRPSGPAPTGMSVEIYEIAGDRPFG